mgnify:CR=1 FL=1
MACPIGNESDRAEEEPTQERPYRQEIIVPEVSRAGTYRTEPAIDNDFATPDEIES